MTEKTQRSQKEWVKNFLNYELWFFLGIFLILSGCKNDNSSTPEMNQPTTSTRYLSAQGPNVLNIHIGKSSVCGQNGYVNEPCTSITICVPGTSNCQTISDILIDTGSVGLRLFSSVIQVPLTFETDSNKNTIAECAQFGTGSTWGPVAVADVVLGGEPPVSVPIQVIDKNFSKPPQECSQADADPTQAGYNGILGVGLFTEDCGIECTMNSSIRMYYSCSGTTCNSATLPRSQQLQNPIARLPTDSNGLIIALPPVGRSGALEINGVMILGIGTQQNNTPAQVVAYPTDNQGNFTTQLGNSAIKGSFIDSGSNGLFFPNFLKLAECSAESSEYGFYCPSEAQNFTAINFSYDDTTRINIPFSIHDAKQLVEDGNLVFSNLGGTSSFGFDWGLPFFLGRVVFEGIENRKSTLGVGPYWAY